MPLAVLVVSTLLAVAGRLLLDPDLAAALDPGAEPKRMQLLYAGVGFVRMLLSFDILLLLGLIAATMRWGSKGSGDARPPKPLAPRGLDLHDPGLSNAFFDRLLIGLVVVAVLVRIPGLNTDLWMDEVFTLVAYVRLEPLQILSDFRDDNQHMLFSFLSHLCLVLFGEEPWAIRLPAVAFGVASVWMTARMGRAWLGAREGLVAGALMATAYHAVWFSQNARGYTMLLFFTLWSTQLFLSNLREPRLGRAVAYGVAIALGAASHLTIVFVGIAHAAVFAVLFARSLAGDREARRGALWPAAGLLLAPIFVLHVYAVTVPQAMAYFSQPGAGSTTGPVEWSSPIWMINEVLRQAGVGLGLGWLGLLVAGGFGALGVWHCARRDWIWVVVALLPAVLGTLTMLALGRSLWPRFFFNQLGFVAIIAAAGGIAVGEQLVRLVPRAPRWLSFAPVAVLLLASLVSLPRDYLYPKQDYTGARDFVKAHLEPGDEVVALHLAGRVYERYYEPSWHEISDLESFEAKRAAAEKGGGRTWVLYTMAGYLYVSRPELMTVLEEEFEVVETFPGTLGDGTIVVRRSLPGEAS